MWLYLQRSGELIAGDGEVIPGGYAGAGDAKNDPEQDGVKDVGPLPRGRYTIGPPKALKGGPHGPYVLPLIPSPRNDMKGREGFLMHGDKIGALGTASNGCIVEPRAVRERVAGSGDPTLLVLPDREDIPT